MPDLPNRPRYAARLNAFKVGLPGRPTLADMVGRAATVAGLDAADLNYPDHFADHAPDAARALLARHGMALNGLAMRYYTHPGYRLGAFTNPDPATRRAAIAEVADHAPGVDIALEYKPNEPRAYALMPDIGSTLLAIAEAGRANLGVTLDFAHVLYADELPAHAAALVARRSRLLGVHLNDGYGKRDDGLMVGSVHPVQTVELFVALERMGYDGVLYFDTFPDHGGADPCAEAAANIVMAERLRAVAARLVGDPALAAAIAAQDAPAGLRIVADALYGAR